MVFKLIVRRQLWNSYAFDITISTKIPLVPLSCRRMDCDMHTNAYYALVFSRYYFVIVGISLQNYWQWILQTWLSPL
jgi:hypothetical protein